MKRTITILILIITAVGLGYVYEQVSIYLQKRAHPIEYEEYVMKYSEEYNVPPAIIYSVIKAESSFNSAAISSAGAVGLMQLMPDTFEDIASRLLGESVNEGLLYDPNTNIKYGTFYLKHLYDRFKSWDLTFAAYNAGPSNVNKWLTNPEYIINNEIVYIPIEETRNYVIRVNKNRDMYTKLYFS